MTGSFHSVSRNIIYLISFTVVQPIIFNIYFILVDGSASLSSLGLQGVVASTQALRSQGPSLTPSLANYFRADLIAHVTNWPADLLEKQVNIAAIQILIRNKIN